MARGKYAEKAAKRQAEMAVTSDLASYQHRVTKLTAESRELRETLDAERRANAQAQKRLRAERDEGVAPQVEALRLALNAARSERDLARSHAKKEREDRKKLMKRAVAHFVEDHQMALPDAFELIMRWTGGPGAEWDGLPIPTDVQEDRVFAAATDAGIDPNQALTEYRKNRSKHGKKIRNRPGSIVR